MGDLVSYQMYGWLGGMGLVVFGEADVGFILVIRSWRVAPGSLVALCWIGLENARCRHIVMQIGQ